MEWWAELRYRFKHRAKELPAHRSQKSMCLKHSGTRINLFVCQPVASAIKYLFKIILIHFSKFSPETRKIGSISLGKFQPGWVDWGLGHYWFVLVWWGKGHKKSELPQASIWFLTWTRPAEACGHPRRLDAFGLLPCDVEVILKPLSELCVAMRETAGKLPPENIWLIEDQNAQTH